MKYYECSGSDELDITTKKNGWKNRDEDELLSMDNFTVSSPFRTLQLIYMAPSDRVQCNQTQFIKLFLEKYTD